MTVIYYAYGSNLLFSRLHARCPSIMSLGVARLDNHSMSFNKPGGDRSGKCGIEAVGHSDHVLGVLYQMHRDEKPILDQIEGVGHGYRDREIEVVTERGTVSCFTYYPTRLDASLPPWDWYKAFVLHGARENSFPTEYLNRIEAVEAMVDPDHQRRQLNFDVLQRQLPLTRPDIVVG